MYLFVKKNNLTFQVNRPHPGNYFCHILVKKGATIFMSLKILKI